MEPLDMDRFLDCGEFDMERSAFAGRRADINLSGMFLDNSVTYREAKTGAAATGFSGEERVKDAMDVLAGNSCARIRHFDLDAAVMRGGTDFKHSATGHGVARRSEEHTSELQSQSNLVCRLLLEKKKKRK